MKASDTLNDIVFLLTLMSWLMNFDLLLIGVLVGSLGTLAGTPASYRLYRRWILRRRWRQNLPRYATESLAPRWQEYDPELAGVGKRCICHRRRIPPGERVLLWPETGPLGMLHVAVYCETVKE